MKTHLTKEQADEIAAICYLAIWQIGEFNPCLKPVPDSQALEFLNAQPFEKILGILGYPTDPVFDNESEPLIVWQSGLFNEKTRESLVYVDIPSLFTETSGD